MDLIPRIALAALGSALLGALAGFVAALLALASKELRNSWLVARGRIAYKDCVLPLSFVTMNVLVSLPLGGVLGAFYSPLRATLLAALVPAALLTLLSVGGSISQALSD